jgi:hypothetical protein
MSYQAAQQAVPPPLPPIPKMEPATPVAPTAPGLRSEIRQAVKEAVQQAKQAQADARTAAQDARIAAKDGQAVIRAQAPQGGIPTTAPPPPSGGDIPDIPPQVVNVLQMFFVFVVALVLGTPLVRMMVRRFDRKTEAMRVSGPDFTPHLRQLQESVDAMAIEIERISEGQRFTSKLLASRANASPLASAAQLAEQQAKD